MRNRWARWIVAILFWSALGALFALPGISSPHWNRQLLRPLTFWWAWGLLTPLIFWVDACLPFKEKQLEAHPGPPAGEHSSSTSAHLPGRCNQRRSGHYRMELSGRRWLRCKNVQRGQSRQLGVLLGHLRCAPDLPILRALSSKRAAAGANGAQLLRSAPERLAHATRPAFPVQCTQHHIIAGGA